MSSLLGALDLPPLPLLYVRGAPTPAPDLSPPTPTPALPTSTDVDICALLGIPPIGLLVDAVPPRVAESTNPGTTNPRQQNLTRRVCVDQTMSATPSGGLRANSDGQVQLLDPTAGQRGVTVTRETVPLYNSDGNFQTPNFNPSDGSVTVDQRSGGLPMESRPDSQGHVRMTKVTADFRSPAITVMPDSIRPGGKLPTNHNIK